MEAFKEWLKKYLKMFTSIGFTVSEKNIVSKNKESKLLAIQIHADFAHTRYSLAFSYIFGFLVAGIFADLTLFYEHLFSRGDTAGFLIALLVVAYLGMNESNKDYRRKLIKFMRILMP